MFFYALLENANHECNKLMPERQKGWGDTKTAKTENN